MAMVKDLMVPIEEYAVVPEDATILEALEALEKAQDMYYKLARHRHRALLVRDKSHRIVGKLSQIDVLMALEPKYRTEAGSQTLAHTSSAGLSPGLLKSLMAWYSLWEETFAERCKKVANMKVKDCMYTPRGDEYVKESDSLELAIHQLVMGRHQSLLVTRGQTIVGVLKLIDVFQEAARQINACKESSEAGCSA